MTSIYLHIGLHKTGTTYFQREVFPRLPQISYIGRPFLYGDSLLGLVACRGERILLSHEDFAGRLLDSFIEGASWIHTQTKAIGRLAVTFPRAGIILGLRRHDSFILSLYKSYLKYGGAKPFSEFFDIERDQGVIRVQDLYFEPRLRQCASVFSGGVFVAFCEELAVGFEPLILDLSAFLGVAPPALDELRLYIPNPGVNEAEAKILHRLNLSLPYASTISLSPRPLFRFLRKIRLTPHSVSGAVGKILPRRPLTLPRYCREFIASTYQEDWDFALDFAATARSRSFRGHPGLATPLKANATGR